MDNSHRLIQTLIEAINAHDIDRMVNCYSTGFVGVDVAEPNPQFGLESIRSSIGRYLGAFPDLAYTPEEIISNGDTIAIVWRAQGTHLGTWANIPPSRRRVTIRGMSRLKVGGGKITDVLTIWDVAGLLRAIGLLPQL